MITKVKTKAKAATKTSRTKKHSTKNNKKTGILALAGLWNGYSVDAKKLRQEAWRRN